MILTGVTIATLTGGNGILTQASKAGEKTKMVDIQEQVKLEVMGSYNENGKFDLDKIKKNLRENLEITDIEDIGEEENRKLKFEVDKNEIKVNNKGEMSIIDKETGIYQLSSTIDGQKESSKDNPIIPEGFKPINEGEAVWGNGEQAPEKKSVDNGLVIEDIDHNQFVWVPVESGKFERGEGYANGKKQSLLSTYSEPSVNGYPTEEEEYNKMYSSVTTNGGFYIGRFETGKDERGNVVVQKDVNPYTNIGWSNSNDMKNEKGGAVEKSKEFKKGKAYENSVTSTLIYGIQWYATMQFFDNKYIEGIPTENIKNSYVSNSTGRGNYDEEENTNEWKGKVAKTGSSPQYEVKNIYDMAGNVVEWTMEACDSAKQRIYKGGFYSIDGFLGTVSSTEENWPSYATEFVGFRITLYI